ncbi:MAG TPA: F0F1 ATP synthase subunit A [Nocardioidaceae bacterium]|nr:F0F1 ATP synthase subunit A [Nocardioidaceae bacterium]
MSDGVHAAPDITIGHHVTVEFLGFTLNADTIWSTAIAGMIVIGLGFWMRSKITSGVPSKIQVIWEALIGAVTRQVEASLGHINPFVVPLAVALFAFILIANWLHAIPSGDDPHYLPAPTADVNLTYALGLLVIVGVHVFSIQRRGLKGYIKHYFQPYPILFPINLLEELVKPFTLALRLFGNIFSGGILVTLIGLFPLWILWGPNAVWKLFDMFVGLIQAFIFALLTILYFGMAGERHDEEEAHDPPTKDALPDTGTPPQHRDSTARTGSSTQPAGAH